MSPLPVSAPPAPAAEPRLPRAPDLARAHLADDLLGLIPPAFALRHRLLPLKWTGDRLEVAVADSFDPAGIDALGSLLGVAVDPFLAPPDEIDAALLRFRSHESSATGIGFGGDGRTTTEVDTESAMDAEGPGDRSVDDTPVITLVHRILLSAIARRASDVHFEPMARRFRVRFRVDGVLLETENPPRELQLPIISRLKIMANISIAEKRMPQDGRLRVLAKGRQFDLRVASVPTAHGESIVIRILDQQGQAPGLPELGLFPDDVAKVRELIARPDGIILVTGPTGSGKTTTLYSCLQAINQRERKIITVEDPVEYQLPGVNQVPVRPAVGMTFAAALRAMLRQAPNIVMVGEIRDRETAEIAIHASLTGHLVLSTLHTRDAPGAVARLIDLGVNPFLVASALRASLAQRLVRRICPACARPHLPVAAELQALNLTPADVAGATIARGGGCAACHWTGYLGRTGVFEAFIVNERLQGLIHERAGEASLRRSARTHGMRTLREDGIRKVTGGLTTIEEVASITAGESS